MKIKINKTIAIAVVVLVLSIGANFALAEKNTPWENGFKLGCDDATKDTSDRYINKPGKGPSHHTDDFMNGYNRGVKDCTNEEDSTFVPNSAEAFFNQPQYQKSSNSYSYNSVSSSNDDDDDDNRHTSCGPWSGGKSTCTVDGTVVVLNSPTHVDTVTQAQTQTQHVTCITIFSVCGSNNQQGQVASTSFSEED